ncbi:hypothetical protein METBISCDRAFT_27745 [Metschnikowia bicuspidata]|uniref:Insulin-degrading enzyme n=1 Tax=Metschnikowia bicuspidata TaxID=27322 RepID=A0A4P9ZB60_9ASCO|nr:hypothetical protein METBISCDRAFT_27745 [Metschnikowia bicuspidata]
MRDSYTILADGSAILKPALDERSYRFLKLNNNLHVLVIHDASTDRAGASLDVNVGSFADKNYGVPGLAHFCEHLLFMGTAKYPAENTYSSYLAKHSGHSNAYTAAEHTNYYFEVSADHLEGALDRFAQFFICPLFSTSCKDREICAVDSENKKNLQNDLWRMYQLDKLTSNPAHPYNSFSTGNLATLNDEPASRGVNVRDVLLRFYCEQYSANLMSLVVLGRQSLDVLTEWVLLKFSDVPDHGLARPFYDGCPLYAPEQMCKLTCARPIMVSNKLEVSFPIPSDMEQQWRSKPAQYYSHLLGHESKGSLLYFLKNLNWVNELSAGNMKVCQGTSLFMVELELTPDGLANWQAVLAHLFEYLHMVKLQPPQLWLWREISDMSKIDFCFRQKTGTASTVSKMSNALHKFAQNLYIPPENLLDYTILRDFDPAEITAYGAHLVPSNLRITITSQLLDDLPEREKWYGTEYSFDDIPGDLMSRLHKVSQNPALHLPVPNTFIPKDFTVHGQKAVEPLRHPHLICDTCKFETWYKQDDTFCVPKGYINITIHAPPLGASVEAAAMGTLLCELFDDALADLKYYASIVGLSSSIFQYRDAFSLKFGGYNDKLPALLELVLRNLVAFAPTEDRLEPIKYKVTKALVNAAYENPYTQIGNHFLQFVNEKTHTDAQKLAALERISFDDLSRFAKSLWEQGVFVQTLIHGNFEYAAAALVHTLIKDICKPLPAISEMAAEVYQKVNFQSHVLETAEHARYEMVLTDPVNVNSCIEYFIQIGRICAENARLRVLTNLLCVILLEPCFNQLRTKEQLGYVVFSGYRLNRSHFGMRILVQSERPCEYLEFRIEKFLERFRTKKLGAEFTEDAFAKFKQALKLKKLTKLNNLHEECSSYWTHINDGYYDFEQKQRDVAILDTITKKEFLLFVSEHLAFGAGHQSARISVYLKSQKQPLFDRNKNFSAVVHNYMYENDHDKDVVSDVLDEIIERSKFDTVAVADELCKKLSIADAAAFKEKFTAQIEARTQSPTPPEYSKGQLYTLDSEFKSSHALGGRPEPVTELKSLYYPKEEARL